MSRTPPPSATTFPVLTPVLVTARRTTSGRLYNLPAVAKQPRPDQEWNPRPHHRKSVLHHHATPAKLGITLPRVAVDVFRTVSGRYLDSQNLDSQNRVMATGLGLGLGLVMTVQILTVQIKTGNRLEQHVHPFFLDFPELYLICRSIVEFICSGFVRNLTFRMYSLYHNQLSLTNPCDARCITANVLQTKVDAQCDKLATELS